MDRSELATLADKLDDVRRARLPNMADYVALLERAIAAFDDDAATAGEVFELPELYDELWQAYETTGRIDDALAAADAAVAAGLRSAPDPRCLRAEILMRAGRIAEAEPIWAAVRADTPDDVWVYNNAGLEYAAAGEHQTALEWLTAGLRLAIETGDRYRLVDQLAEQREESMFALRLADDELQARALAFAEEQSRADEARRTALDAARRTARGPEPDIARGGPGPVREVAWVWLPADEYERGLQAWPDLRGRVDQPT